jgi:hypothetical protein
MLSRAAERRLVLYCRRAEAAPCVARQLDPALRAIIWSDSEVRTACLKQDYGEFAAIVTRYGPWGLTLLDVVTAMSYEAKQRAETPLEAA